MMPFWKKELNMDAALSLSQKHNFKILKIGKLSFMRHTLLNDFELVARRGMTRMY